MGESPSTSRRSGMAPWGWLSLTAVPVWLLWVTGIGYARKKHCLEGTIDQPAAVTAAERHACAEVPVAWAPVRGLEFGTPRLYGEYWVAGLVLAVILATVVVWLAVRSARRHRSRESALQTSKAP